VENAGLSVSQQDIDRERDIILVSLSADEDEAARLLEGLRDRRGLGPVRYEALLQRNAGLRKLIKDQVTVTDAAIEQAYRLQYGPAKRARLLMAESLNELQKLQAQLMAGEPFAELAAMHSIDPSAAAGGLLPPIRADDTSYPQSIRDAAARLEPGSVSEPLALDGGYALLQVEADIAASDVEFEQIREDLSERVRRQTERALMQQIARELISGADLVVLDPTLNADWERQRNGLIQP
jgi:parvulin-like peptidyl-prolyl isomerase